MKYVAALDVLFKPRSIAIIGISSRPGSPGHAVLGNLTVNEYKGDIYLVGRSGGEVEGRKVLETVEDLPEGVEVAVLILPAAGVKEALEGCVRRKVRTAVIFSSGFAEIGKRDLQNEIAAIARDGGIAIVGPNCQGYTNFIDGLPIGFTGATRIATIKELTDPAFAIVSQSGGLSSHIRQALEARDLPTAYYVSTGNEAVLGLAEFIEYFAQDDKTRCIVVYVEEFRQTQAFVAAAVRARNAGKPILLLSPGKGTKAKAAVSSHTGALAGNYEVMRTIVTHSGIALVETLDELVDTAEIMARFPNPPVKGPGVVTFSGAFCALAHDFCEELGLSIPPLAPETEAYLKPLVPSFLPPKNPLDLGTQPIWQPELMDIGPRALLNDPNIGSLTISCHVGGTATQAMKYLNHLLKALAGNTKPFAFAPLGDRTPLPQEFLDTARKHRIILSRSSDRTLRAMANATFHGRACERARQSIKFTPFTNLPKLGKGTQPEWLGKQFLAAAGIKIPDGALAKTLDEAIETANRVGYPIAVKAQAGALAHKTEAGGVLLNIADETALKTAWQTLHDNIARAQPGLTLDGVLVEKMAARGLELVIGAKRDPLWGPVVLVGLGGIWVEALGDVRLLPPDLSEDAIIEELYQLRTAKLLKGFRGTPPVDVKAVAKAASIIGRLMVTVPEIAEVDVNPVFAHAEGQGITAVDALIVSDRASA